MDEDKVLYPQIIDNNNKNAITYFNNYNNIIFISTYIDQIEIINTCKTLRCKVCIYNLNTNFDNYDVFNYNYETMVTINDIYNQFWPTILNRWVNHNHYKLLSPVNMKEEEYPIEKYLLKNNKLNISLPPKNNNFINTNTKENNSAYNDKNDQNKIDNLSEKFKIELTTFLKNDTKLENIKNFPLSSKNYNSNFIKVKLQPKYITEAISWK